MIRLQYNYLDGTIQEKLWFFETLLENLDAPAPAVKKDFRNVGKNSMKRKGTFFDDYSKDSSEDEKLPSRNIFF